MTVLRIAIGVITTGRPETVRALIALLPRQTRPADRIVVCPATDGDLGMPLDKLPPSVTVVRAPRGSCPQRNAILAAIWDCDLVTFLDDDFVPASDYLAEIEQAFQADPNLAAASGDVIADGINAPGFDLAFARAAIDRHAATPKRPPIIQYNAYGCNMTLRMAPIRAHGLTFDVNLPLYGWLEDVDFSRQISRYGTIQRLYRPFGVHLGSKSGRSSGLRLGYSQVANPIYLVRKGSLDCNVALRHIRGNVLSNTVKALRPEPWIDRRGRLKGNLLAMAHLVQGRLDPRHVLAL